MNSSFPNRWSFSYLKFTKYVTNIIAEPKYKYGQQEEVTSNSKEPQQKCRLGTVSIKILGGLNRFYVWFMSDIYIYIYIEYLLYDVLFFIH